MRTMIDKIFDIDANGDYPLSFADPGRRHFSAKWTGAGDPAGSLAFTFDGNPGDPPATMDLASKDNAFALLVSMAELDLTVTNLPEGGSIRLFCLS